MRAGPAVGNNNRGTGPVFNLRSPKGCMNQPGDKEKATILVVDDDQDIVQTIKGNLELDGYRVLCAHDGRSGVDLAKSRRPDLIILDLNLPDIDGIRVCRIVRREHDFPIIMLTARDSRSDKVLGLECGADDYVVKPFDFLELSARIKAVLARYRRSLVSGRYENGPLRVDYKAKRVWVEEREVRLTQTEFELLELFLSFPGEVLSREFIQNQVWRDAQLYRGSRAIDVHVQRLRKKLEPDPSAPSLLVTVSGVGYKYQADPGPIIP